MYINKSYDTRIIVLLQYFTSSFHFPNSSSCIHLLKQGIEIHISNSMFKILNLSYLLFPPEYLPTTVISLRTPLVSADSCQRFLLLILLESCCLSSSLLNFSVLSLSLSLSAPRFHRSQTILPWRLSQVSVLLRRLSSLTEARSRILWQQFVQILSHFLLAPKSRTGHRVWFSLTR